MTQRANGEGSIYRRQDGRWTAASYVLKPDGTRVRRPVYGKTRREVADKLARTITQTKAGLPLAVESWTVERYADHWIRDNVSARLRPSTVSSYRETLRLHIVPTLGGSTLRSLTPTQVRELLAAKTAVGLSARSVRIIHGTLRSMLGEAVRDELVDRNVATVVRAPSVPQQEVQPWSTEEAARFLESVAEHRLCALFAVGVALGLRKGELLALRWEDVDLDGGTMRQRDGPPRAQRLRGTEDQADVRQWLAWTDSGLVFTSTVGTVVEPRNLTRLFDELIVEAGARRIRFHDLRHTCASLLLAQNVPARVVMEVLGHSQLSMTTDLYSHVMPTALREAATAMDRALSQQA